METVQNILFLALHSVVPWLAAAFFALLGLWFGYSLWFDWVRQIRPLRAEHRELSRRLEGLTAGSASVASPAATAPFAATHDDASAVTREAAGLNLSPGSLTSEFWPIPEKAPVPTVITGEVVPDKVRNAAGLVGISSDPAEISGDA